MTKAEVCKVCVEGIRQQWLCAEKDKGYERLDGLNRLFDEIAARANGVNCAMMIAAIPVGSSMACEYKLEIAVAEQPC